MATDDVKHLADSLDLLAKSGDKAGMPSPFARIHALKFYDLAHAPHSLFRVGQDLVDQFVERHDFDGALQFMEDTLLPQLQQWKLADFQITVRSQYAVILAFCRQYDRADAEMARLKPYLPGLSPLLQQEVGNQTKLIADLKRSGPPPKWTMPQNMHSKLASHFGQAAPKTLRPLPENRQKIGRNEPCSCGSGRKFKHCHG